MSDWQERRCETCGGKLFVRADWVAPPKVCDRCRAAAVRNLVQKLRSYIENRRRFDDAPVFGKDRDALARDRELRSKLSRILDNEPPQDVIARLVDDKEIRQLILRLERQAVIGEKAQQKYKAKTGSPTRFDAVSIVPGGAPGLGKKS